MYSTEKLAWRKSNYSNDNSACVELRIRRSTVGVRDSKQQGGPVLTVGTAAMRAFLGAVADGRLDR
ncbi:DUF397 domain-containing protein [Streptomyces albus]|uniref:DUF397 domain-containing protein n=1 Tax=Streptomyces albus TaxID=1888 RepID=UPI0006E38138|nr:DUF397 domain-containing protein [Streptomyces albus]